MADKRKMVIERVKCMIKGEGERQKDAREVQLFSA
jgi:hypothetical protein